MLGSLTDTSGRLRDDGGGFGMNSEPNEPDMGSVGRLSRRGFLALAGIGVAVTAAAIFGSVYKVSKPIIYAPWVAIAVFVVGLALSFVYRGDGRTAAQQTTFAGLTPAEQGPVKI